MQKLATASRPILVYADDDEDDLLLVSEALQRYHDDLDMQLFESGYAAYNYLLTLEKAGQKPCLIILDMNMPAMGGRELLSVLRNIPFFEHVPVILFTTSSQEHDYRFALQHNAGFITKPMAIQQMDIIAEQFLAHCSSDIREKIKRDTTDRF